MYYVLSLKNERTECDPPQFGEKIISFYFFIFFNFLFIFLVLIFILSFFINFFLHFFTFFQLFLIFKNVFFPFLLF